MRCFDLTEVLINWKIEKHYENDTTVTEYVRAADGSCLNRGRMEVMVSKEKGSSEEMPPPHLLHSLYCHLDYCPYSSYTHSKCTVIITRTNQFCTRRQPEFTRSNCFRSNKKLEE